MVSAVKRITTKKSGELMAFVTIEGLEGSVEMLCFPAVYQENKELLVEDKVVKIKGRVDHKDEAETKFIPLAIEPFVAQDRAGAPGALGRRRPSSQHGHRRPQGHPGAFPGAVLRGHVRAHGRRRPAPAPGRRLQGRSPGQPVRRTARSCWARAASARGRARAACQRRPASSRARDDSHAGSAYRKAALP